MQHPPPDRLSRPLRLLATTLFIALSIILLALTLVSPGDMIYQSHRDNRLGNIFVVASVYLGTVVVAAVVYASRVVTNRAVLAGIPKPWVPVERGDVTESVRRVVADGLRRSAAIAQQAHPLSYAEWAKDAGAVVTQETKDSESNAYTDADRAGAADVVAKQRPLPPWGVIAHPGWTAPDSPDLPDCEFERVIVELPNLIEAKAVSLAPGLETVANDGGDATRLPDERIVEALQRPRAIGLRDYVSYLLDLLALDDDGLTSPLDETTTTSVNMMVNMAVIDTATTAHAFVRLYEYARFSGQPLRETEFRALMGLFARLLRAMDTVDRDEVLERVMSEVEGRRGGQSQWGWSQDGHGDGYNAVYGGGIPHGDGSGGGGGGGDVPMASSGEVSGSVGSLSAVSAGKRPMPPSQLPSPSASASLPPAPSLPSSADAVPSRRPSRTTQPHQRPLPQPQHRGRPVLGRFYTMSGSQFRLNRPGHRLANRANARDRSVSGPSPVSVPVVDNGQVLRRYSSLPLSLGAASASSPSVDWSSSSSVQRLRLRPRRSVVSFASVGTDDEDVGERGLLGRC